MKYKALIFDFEGTLVNFAWDKESAVREVKEMLGKHGIHADGSYAEIYNLISSEYPNLRDGIDRIYDKYDLLAFQKWRVKGEVYEVLPKIYGKKAVVSNVNGDLLRRALMEYGIAKFFYIVVGRKDVDLLKPSDAGIKLAIESLGVEREEVLFVGDSISDLLACRKAGIDIAVVEGENRIEELDADYKLTSLLDIFSLPVQGL